MSLKDKGCCQCGWDGQSRDLHGREGRNRDPQVGFSDFGEEELSPLGFGGEIACKGWCEVGQKKLRMREAVNVNRYLYVWVSYFLMLGNFNFFLLGLKDNGLVWVGKLGLVFF